jgi:hypothetical protein
LVGDPLHPTTLYVGGTVATPTVPDNWHDYGYGYWRSTDGGATWSDLGHALGLSDTYMGNTDSTGDPADLPYFDSRGVDSFTIAPDDSYLLSTFSNQPSTPGSGRSWLIRSTDGGVNWTQESNDSQEEGYGSGPSNPVISPVSPRRVYSEVFAGGNGGPVSATVQVSGDGGKTWAATGDTSALTGDDTDLESIVADPAHADTVYAGNSSYWLRSDDAGATWGAVITPTDTLALTDLSLSTDRHLPGLLVASTSTKGIPADRRYLSSDEGRTWKIATCPGDLAGSCPRFTVDNVFGVGASYGFYADGIHPFQAGGPAGARLAISAALPVPTAHLAAMVAGRHAGDPIYLLSDEKAGALAGRLYRSTDAGRSWQPVATDSALLPNLRPPSSARGTLLVRATRHSVAAPFVAMYRKLGLRLIGYPVTEAYLQGDTLTQDFEHLRLQVVGGRVVVAPFGVDVFFYGTTPDEPGPAVTDTLLPSVKPIAQAPSGKFAAFWRAHGGLAVFGAPITDVFESKNGDGSGRNYTMQYFQNARLELHPEIKDPTYRITLGLLGQESLQGRGWIAPKS